jgi:hypothetical protein
MIRRIILLASLSGLLSACASNAASAPTPFPPDYLPTIVALTGQAALATSFALTPTDMPTATSLPEDTPIPQTPLPTFTPTFEPGFTEFAKLRFLSPGPMSRVISPLQLNMMITSGESGIVKIDLLGEDGRTLFSKLERVSFDRTGAYRSWKIPFEIRAVAEQGYIQVSTKDSYGRIQSLNTLQIFLLSTGADEINPPGNIIYERVALENFKDGMKVFGGVIALKGRIWPFNEQPVFIDLLSPDGIPIATRILTFDGIEPQSFETTLPYKVAETMEARLSFRQVDPVLNIPVYVFTREVELNP